MTRIADLAANNILVARLLRSQDQLHSLELQMASEKKAQNYMGISTVSERLVNLENMKTGLEGYVEHNETAELRNELMLTTMEAIETEISEFKEQLSSFRQQDDFSENAVANIQKFAFDHMIGMEAYLNLEVNGQYLFAGARANEQPVSLGLSSLSAFQSRYDGATVTYPTTRDAHLARLAYDEDVNNKTSMFIDADNFLQFRQDADGVTSNLARGTISATSALFSGLQAGSTVTIADTASNNGTYTVESVSSNGTSITVKTEMLTNETVNELVTAGTDLAAENVTFTLEGSGNQVTFTAGTNTIQVQKASSTEAVPGAFSDLSAGDTVTFAGTGANNATYTVLSVSSDGSEITTRENVTGETDTNGLSVTGSNSFNYATYSIDQTTTGNLTYAIDPVTGDNTITAANAGTLSGIPGGAWITLSNSVTTSNNGTFKVASNDGTTITLVQNPTTMTLADGTTLENSDTGDLSFSRSGDTITAATAGAFSAVAVGETFTISGTDENDGTYTVSANTGTVITIESKKITDEGLSGNTFFDQFSDTDIEFTSATKRIEVRQSGTATAIPDIFKGLFAGDTVTIAGTASNNKTFTIASVASDYSYITVNQDVVNETDVTGATINGSGTTSFAYTSGTQMVFTNVGAAGTDTLQIQDSGGGAVANAFANLRVGEKITVTGTAGHDATYTIKSISADKSQVTVHENMTASATDSNGARIRVYAASGSVTSTPYYYGDAVSVTHRLDDDRSFETAITAADPAFEKAIRAMAIIAQGVFATEGGLDRESNQQRVTAALYLLDDALNSVTEGTPPYGTEKTSNMQELVMTVGNQAQILESTNALHNSFISFLESSTAKLENVDPLEIITALLDQQRSLEASYQALARVQQLSLHQFL